MLQYSAIFHCYSTQSFLITTAHEATQSFCKITELSYGRAWVGGDAWATRGSVAGSHGTKPRGTQGTLARSISPLVRFR
jgi:hypothetical protein